MLPLSESDILDFIFTYFKAEYAPIRSFWSTAQADPRQPARWLRMGHELQPLSFRPANAQAQKDLESLDYFIRTKNLDAAFVRGIVVRYAKYEVHERLEKKLYESARLDLMVRKALKEKHLLDTLWPSPAPRDLGKELLQQGVRVRQWYGDMFNKYFRVLHSVDDFQLRPEVDAKIKSSGTLMLVPFAEHLVLGDVDPIVPIVAQGAGYANSQTWRQKERHGTFGEPERFEVRVEAPPVVEETVKRGVTRQCLCLKCGAKRDVKVSILIDPSPEPAVRKQNNTGPPPPRGQRPRQRYSPGYAMSGEGETNNMVGGSQPQPMPQQQPPEDADSTSTKMKPCPKCTFLNHPDLTACEMCSSDLPETVVSKPPSPELSAKSGVSSSTSTDAPPSTVPKNGQSSRPTVSHRQTLSSTLFSIFPFSQQHQSEHHAKLPPSQPQAQTKSAAPQKPAEATKAETSTTKYEETRPTTGSKSTAGRSEAHSGPPTSQAPATSKTFEEPSTPPLSKSPEMAMMPLVTPPLASAGAAESPFSFPAGMPHTLTEYDYVTASPALPPEEREELEHSGWVDMSKGKGRQEVEQDDDSEDESLTRREGLIDLDAVAREEMGVWGRNEEEDEDDDDSRKR